MKAKIIGQNVVELSNDNGEKFLQSYNSIIIKIDKTGQIFFDVVFYNYSKTTIKHRNQYLGLTSQEIEQGLRTGLYKFENLNI